MIDDTDYTEAKDINHIKVMLVKKKVKNKELAEKLGKDPATVSKWCTNKIQLGLEGLLQIANILEVDVKGVALLLERECYLYSNTKSLNGNKQECIHSLQDA